MTPDSVMMQILELARWAPSGDNTQPWRFEVVDEMSLVVHGFDTRDHCVYDLDGRPSQLSLGAVLETIAIAASAHGLGARVDRRAHMPESTPTFDVRFEAHPGHVPDPLVSCITRRSVQRRPMSLRPLTSEQKLTLETSMGSSFRVVWFEPWRDRIRIAGLMFRNARLRLTMPEAYRVHRDIIEWDAQFSADRVPDQALGVGWATLRLMRFVMSSWARVDFFNTYLAGTVAPRIQMDFVPSLACAAHFALQAQREPSDLDDFIAAGRAVQRFWLTATSLGLHQQPELTPLIFARYVRNDLPFTKTAALQVEARNLRQATTGLLGEGAQRTVWMGRVGSGRPPAARSFGGVSQTSWLCGRRRRRSSRVTPDKGVHMRRTRRVLFFAEAVTLAHVARPIALAQGLDRSQFEVFMACDARYERFIDTQTCRHLPLSTISSEQFLRALGRGSPVYDESTLHRYVTEDLDLIRRFKPDLIVGDFRLSLSVSARIAGIPYATICNAYWSPHYIVRDFPLPALPITRVLPLPMARVLFRWARPLAFGLHCRPLNEVRKAYGLPSLGSDLRHIYTDADIVLYADAQSMFPIEHLPPGHHFLGPIAWSPGLATPDWWGELPSDKPVVYLGLGSSGPPGLLYRALDGLKDQKVSVVASTAGLAAPSRIPANAQVAAYLPGADAAARSSVVICNGGSLTSHQALAAGVPLIGIASNLDQFLNMQAVEREGAGVTLRADRFDGPLIRRELARVLSESRFRSNASRLGRDMAEQHAVERFSDIVADST